jgi:type IV pilus assembly protein PilB
MPRESPSFNFENKNNFPIFDLINYNPEWLYHSGIKPELIARYHVLPLSRDEHSLQLGLADPTDYAAISAISFHTGLRIHPVFVAQEELDKIINRLCRSHILYSQLETTLSKLISSDLKENSNAVSSHRDSEPDDEPVIEFVYQLMDDAITKHISDIHIEPFEHHCRIRFRRDGLLYEAASVPLHLANQIIMRLKIMAQLDIAEKRLPQDGRLHIHSPTKIDIRINTCPTFFGEKIVLRILDATQTNHSIDSLGMNDTQKELFYKQLSQPQGLILVTGPTGSGKTMTLYAALHHLNQIEKNISTAEDPVEIELPGINQVNIHSRIGLDFATTLRALLRQDPDIIMIGEIRDAETATIALQAAQTGHLVLSTLHTNHANETLSRLQSMGIATHYLKNAVSLIIAQRLVRKLCIHCHPRSLTRSVICEHCHHGYKGRTGIFEFLTVNADQTPPPISLWEAGLEKVRAGITNHDEIRRVIVK